MFDQPDHVIAEIAEETGGGLRQIIGQFDLRLCDQCAQCGQRITVLCFERVGVVAGGTVDAALSAVALPDHVGFHTDDRVPTAHLSSGHAFEDKGVLGGPGEFEHQRHGRVEIGGKAGIDHLVLTCLVGAGKAVEIGGQVGHGAYWMKAWTALIAGWLISTPARCCTSVAKARKRSSAMLLEA